jgi:hypothetical protein
LPVEQILLTGKALANDIEEGADPRCPFQVSVGHDPEFAGQVRRRSELGG